MEYYKFYKETSGRWYVDLPDAPFTQDEMEMVMGADTLLDLLAQGEATIEVCFSATPFPQANELRLERLGDFEGGGYYQLHSLEGLDYVLSVWLCDVTLYVFGEMPQIIYFR